MPFIVYTWKFYRYGARGRDENHFRSHRSDRDHHYRHDRDYVERDYHRYSDYKEEKEEDHFGHEDVRKEKQTDYHGERKTSDHDLKKEPRSDVVKGNVPLDGGSQEIIQEDDGQSETKNVQQNIKKDGSEDDSYAPSSKFKLREGLPSKQHEDRGSRDRFEKNLDQPRPSEY